MNAIRIETERLVLREWEAGDFDAVHAYASDPDTVRHLVWGPNTPGQTREFLKTALAWRGEVPRSHFEFAVTLKEAGTLIGGCGLTFEAGKAGEAQVGYVLHRDRWRKGYGLEAVHALVERGRREWGLKTLWSTCNAENEASWRLMEKLGMKRVALWPKHIQLRSGKWRDTLIYRMEMDLNG